MAKKKPIEAPEAVPETLSEDEAKAALESNRQARLKEFNTIVEEAAKRLNCTLLGRIEIIGDQIRSNIISAAR